MGIFAQAVCQSARNRFLCSLSLLLHSSAAMGNNFGKLEDHYHIHQGVRLGEGAFGTVLRGEDKRTQQFVAVKELRVQNKRGKSDQDYDREYSTMNKFSHPNILKVFGVFKEAQCVYIVLEYCDSDLGKLLKLGRRMSDCEMAGYTCQICSALGVLHAARVVHRDVKPENFMISKDTLKLGDFGVAASLPSTGALHDKCGTPAFMAPELHRLPHSSGYDAAVDMWALGVILSMMQHGGRHPFLKDGALDMDAVLKGKHRKNKGTMSASLSQFFGRSSGAEGAKELRRDLLSADPKLRPTASDVLSNSWLKYQMSSI